MGKYLLDSHAMSEAKLFDLPEGTEVDLAGLRERLNKPGILMHSGIYFGIRATESENAHTKKALAELCEAGVKPNKHGIYEFPEADLEVHALAAVYSFFGHKVTMMPAQYGAIDGIFSTDSDKTFQLASPTDDKRWVMGKILSITPRFTHESRQVEEPWKRKLLETTLAHHDPKARRRIIQMAKPMEFGDTRVIFHKVSGKDKPFILAGVAETNEMAIGRSTPEGHKEFEGYLKEYLHPDIEVVTVYLRQPFYHMDTTGPRGNGGHLFTNQKAYQPKSWELLQSLFGDGLVELPFEDIADAFGGNATNFGKRMHISDKISEQSIRILREHGYDVILTPIEHTMLGGGGHRCMTSINPHIYVPGGYDSEMLGMDFSKTGHLFKVNIDYEVSGIVFGEINSQNQMVNDVDLGGEAIHNFDISEFE